MIPAGYLLKITKPPPDWLGAPGVAEVCNVAACFSPDVIDVQMADAHNGFGVANDPEVLWRMAREGGVDVTDARLFYYEAHHEEMVSDGWSFDRADWRPLSQLSCAGVSSAPSPVASAVRLLGYDVVVFEDCLEHSPLLCNSIAATLPVNRYCLLETLALATEAVESGAFGAGCEAGTYRIFSVSVVDLA